MKEKLIPDVMFDNAIVKHGFTPYLRDYDVIVEQWWADPPNSNMMIGAQYRYRFTHVPFALTTTSVGDETWRISWDDVFTNYQAWEAAGNPDGYVWGVNFSNAYPGLSYVEESPLAKEWTDRLGHDMHEVRIETNGHNLTIIFHDVEIRHVANADRETGEMIPLPGDGTILSPE